MLQRALAQARNVTVQHDIVLGGADDVVATFAGAAVAVRVAEREIPGLAVTPAELAAVRRGRRGLGWVARYGLTHCACVHSVSQTVGAVPAQAGKEVVVLDVHDGARAVASAPLTLPI